MALSLAAKCFEFLKAKELISTCSNGIYKYIEHNSPIIYAGFDPTAPSFHIGHLQSMLALNIFAAFGFQTIFLLGEATASLGDPSDKLKSRPVIDTKIIQTNVISLQSQLAQINLNMQNTATFQNLVEKNKSLYKKPIYINNMQFYSHMNTIDFLRDIGTGFKINTMVGKEWVKKRLSVEEPILFNEFTYSLFQSHDFHMLNQLHGCNVQLGGEDQWGNITAGIDYIKKKSKKEVHGITLPLLLDSAGNKLSKSSVLMISRDNLYTLMIRIRCISIYSILLIKKAHDC